MLTTLLTLTLTQTGSIQTQHIKTDTPTMIVSHFEKEKTEQINIFQPKQEEAEQPQEKTTEPTPQTESQEPPTTYTFSNNNYTYILDTLTRQLTQTDSSNKTTTPTFSILSLANSLKQTHLIKQRRTPMIPHEIYQQKQMPTEQE
jgi:hypothetical protein